MHFVCLRFTVFTLLLFSCSVIARSQGCSDAGFCTMGAMRPGQSYSKRINFKLRTIEISQYRGSTTLSPVVYATSIDFNFGITPSTSLQVKVPYQWVEGDLGQSSGLSDISFGLTKELFVFDQFKINGTVGGKIPTNKSDLKDSDDRTLPMYYQSSLGSYDLIIGTSLINRNWLIATGIQVALTQNDNRFSYSEWEDYSDQPYLQSYALAYDLKRGVDVMFRIERNFTFANFNFNIGLLPIYRIRRDQILNTETGDHIEQKETRGLALTGTLGANYHFNVNHSMRFLLGRKLRQRELNPDGLTRHQVMTLSYIAKF